MARIIRHLEKIIVGLCLAVFLAAAGYSTVGFRRLDEVAARNPSAGFEHTAYEAKLARIPEIETPIWPVAPAQSRGPEWVYDVFSPPVIYYNPETREFTVTPPANAAPVSVATDTSPYEIELVEVRQEPYRVQLIGYAGSDAAYLATFELLETAETLVARPGSTVGRGEFVLQSFEVRKLVTDSTDSMPVVESVAVATILDQRTGREETLTNRERKMLPRLQGVFRLRPTGEQKLLREGMSVDIRGARYLVTQLSMHPPTAVVSRRAVDALGPADSRTLVVPPDRAGAPR